MAQPPRLDSVLSFSNVPLDQPTNQDHRQDDAAPDRTSFEFAFAPPLHSGDLILPAYPVFDRRLLLDGGHALAAPAALSSTAPPSPDTYCPWVPRSARDPPFPKSASTGEARRWRLRDLVGAGGRSHSDGKEKFVFLQPAAAAPSKMSQSQEGNNNGGVVREAEREAADAGTETETETEAGQQEEGSDGDGHGHRAQALLRPGRRLPQEAAAAGVVPAVPAGDRRVLRQRARARPIAPPPLLVH